MDGAELEFSDNALREIATVAHRKNTGARGLRSVIEDVMFEIMYELPDQEPGQKYFMTPEMIRGEVSPFPPQDDSAAA